MCSLATSRWESVAREIPESESAALAPKTEREVIRVSGKVLEQALPPRVLVRVLPRRVLEKVHLLRVLERVPLLYVLEKALLLRVPETVLLYVLEKALLLYVPEKVLLLRLLEEVLLSVPEKALPLRVLESIREMALRDLENAPPQGRGSASRGWVREPPELLHFPLGGVFRSRAPAGSLPTAGA